MSHLIEHHPQGFVFSGGRQVSGLRSWHHSYRLPHIGLNFRSFFSNQVSLGNIWSISPYIDFPIWQTPKNRLGLNTELGFGYSDSPYDAVNNNKNILWGTSLNYLIQFGLAYERKLGKHVDANMGIQFVHFSNANFRLPNIGLIMFYTNLGLSYRFYQDVPSTPKKELEHEAIRRDWSFSVGASVGFNGAHPFDRATYPSYHVITYASKRLNPKSSVNVGLDYFHNLGVKESINISWYLRGQAKPDFRKLGITLGHELWFGKAAALFQLGAYIYQPYPAPGLLYSRLGLKYQATDNVFGFMTVKFHKGQSEVAEWGLGYRINKRK